MSKRGGVLFFAVPCDFGQFVFLIISLFPLHPYFPDLSAENSRV